MTESESESETEPDNDPDSGAVPFEEVAPHVEYAFNLTRFQVDLLVAMSRHPREKGLAIKDELEAVTHQEVNHGRLYPNLDQLIDKGLAEKEAVDRRTNAYWLTDTGKAVLNHRARWIYAPPPGQSPDEANPYEEGEA